MALASSISFLISDLESRNSSCFALNLFKASCLFCKPSIIFFPTSVMAALFFAEESTFYPFPPQRVQGRPSVAFPVPKHRAHCTVFSKRFIPFPAHTMQGTLAPSGFFPVPEQKTHFFAGSSTITLPVPLQTRQFEIGESKSKGSFPVPLQNAQLICFAMIAAFFLLKGFPALPEMTRVSDQGRRGCRVTLIWGSKCYQSSVPFLHPVTLWR